MTDIELMQGAALSARAALPHAKTLDERRYFMRLIDEATKRERTLQAQDRPVLVWKLTGVATLRWAPDGRPERMRTTFAIGVQGESLRHFETDYLGALPAWAALVLHGDPDGVPADLFGRATTAADGSLRKSIHTQLANRLERANHHALADHLRVAIKVEKGRVRYVPGALAPQVRCA